MLLQSIVFIMQKNCLDTHADLQYLKESPYYGAVPEVQEDNRFAASSDQWLTAFSASPHCH
jgi:hypothetical protein